MVISAGASIVGNTPPTSVKSDYEAVAFFGQVPVKVRGPVNTGDYIVASGLNDGTGIAIPKQKLGHYEPTRIVGQAWETGSNAGINIVNTAVGLNFSIPSLKLELENRTELVKSLTVQYDQLESNLSKQLDQQSSEIKLLMQELNALKQSLNN